MKKYLKRRTTLFVILTLAVIVLAVAVNFFITNFQKTPSPTQSTTVEKNSISENRALEIVSSQKAVRDYLRIIPGAKIQFDHFNQDSNSYVIQVFEVKNDHTNTFNWYEVNKENGELKALLP